MAGTRDTLGALSYCPARARAQDLGAGNFGGKGGDALREAPPLPPPHPPATRRLGSPECPGCPGLAPPCVGVCARSRGLGGPAAATRIRGALWTPRARGPRAPRRPWPGRAGVRAARGCAGTRPRVSGSYSVSPERVRTQGRGVGDDACPLQFCRPSGLVPAPCSRSLARDAAGFGAFPALLRREVKAIVGSWASLPTRVLSIVCHVFIPACEGRPERWCGSAF